LLDDLPVLTLVSNYARLRGGLQPAWVQDGNPSKVDVCAGWRRDGTLVQGSLAAGRQLVTIGPVVPPVEVAVDPDAWHASEPLPAFAVRRRRRVDVVPGATIGVDAFFRDTYMTADGAETGIHEYAVVAHADPVSLVVLDAVADAHVLPFIECPIAADSAARIVGKTLGHLRDEVREEFVGVTTCTHLNDLLRSLDDVVGLLAVAPEP
jgi:hypothetical protein